MASLKGIIQHGDKQNDRLVMLDDILSRKRATLVESIPVNSEFTFLDKPSHCPHCCSTDINGIEVMGAYIGNLLWECDECSSIFLRFEKKKTESCLEEAKGAWTNPKDWGFVPKSEFN